MPGPDDLKQIAAAAAVACVEDGMRVGIGTGSTVAFAIEALARRVVDGLRIEGVATSLATEASARALGIPLIDLGPIDRLDLCIDGVDEIDPGFRAIKGAGGAMLREKIVGAAADRMIAIADMSKRVGQLGGRPVPVEILPMALGVVSRAIGQLGGEPVVRKGRDGGLARSDQGNLIIDARFGAIADPAGLADALSRIPGCLGHGLFLEEIDELYLGTDRGVVKFDRGKGECAETRG